VNYEDKLPNNQVKFTIDRQLKHINKYLQLNLAWVHLLVAVHRILWRTKNQWLEGHTPWWTAFLPL